MLVKTLETTDQVDLVTDVMKCQFRNRPYLMNCFSEILLDSLLVSLFSSFEETISTCWVSSFMVACGSSVGYTLSL